MGTFAYEVSDHVTQLDFSREKACGIDLGLRWTGKRSRWEMGVFYNRFSDYIQLRRTGELAFENADDTFTIVQPGTIDAPFLDQRLASGEENAFLAVTRYTLQDAEYFGMEWESLINLYTEPGQSLDWKVRGDYVEARERSTREPLARIPPLRVMTGLEWSWRSWVFGGDLQYRFRQNKVPAFDNPTSGFAMLNLHSRWVLDQDHSRWTFSAKLENALDREARDATSFVRELTTRPGRNLIMTLNYAY